MTRPERGLCVVMMRMRLRRHSLPERNRRQLLKTAWIIAAVLGLGACGRTETYCYRMTVVVDTPVGPRSGSSVIEVSAAPPGPLSSNDFRSHLRGEAVAVELPGGRVFALLRSPRVGVSAAELYASSAYAAVLPRSYNWRTGMEILKRQTSPALLPAEDFPTFVRFRNPGDPRTIEVVDPANFAAAFGAGVRLDRVSIQITSDPVTSTIESLLPSFGPQSGFDEWLRRLPFTDPRRITRDDFRRGF